MKKFIQFVSVISIALGAALFGGSEKFSNHIMPESNPINMVRDFNAATQASDSVPFYEEKLAAIAATIFGCGVGLLVFGSLGLFVPWINAIRLSKIDDYGSKALGVLAISFAFASILVFGVFRSPWLNGGLLLATLLLICMTVLACVAMIFGWRPLTGRDMHTKTLETAKD